MYSMSCVAPRKISGLPVVSTNGDPLNKQINKQGSSGCNSTRVHTFIQNLHMFFVQIFQLQVIITGPLIFMSEIK